MKRDEDYLKLVDGVKVLNFGSGHAWGMIGLEIETEEVGTIILASDAIYTKESMEPTLKPPGILYDSVGWTNSVEKIKISSRKTHKFGLATMENNLPNFENQQTDIMNRDFQGSV